jgi:two-component system nitrate/nitrite sensor histidine kinase NarX
MIVVQGVSLYRSGGQGFLQWGFFVVPVLMLALVLKSILFVRRSLINPLAHVRQWVSRVRDGDLSARMPRLDNGEFNELAGDINGLADVVQSLHDDLEAQVHRHTQNLERKTQALELLYEAVTSVNAAYEVDDLLAHFLRRLGDVFEADAAVLRVLDKSRLTLMDSYGLDPESRFLEPSVPIRFVWRNNLFGKGAMEVRTESIGEVLGSEADDDTGTVRQIVSVPLQYRDSILGCYQLFIRSNAELASDTRELLAGIGRHLGVALEQSRLDQEAGKLLLVEERARLANELHDSLAQTLASLRFQVRILDETLHQGEEQVTWEELEKLERQVEEANRELRFLIAQFRAPLKTHGVVLSVEKLIRKFRGDTGASVFFQNEWSEDQLSPESRTDVVRIVQEALANIKKHADADTVRVLLRHHGFRHRIVVEDDGIGYDENHLSAGGAGEHIGRQIMLERAENLGALLKLESEPGEGSRVVLEFEYRPGADVPAESPDEPQPMAATA